MPTPRQMHVIAALAAGHLPAELTPVQAQKLFFVLDREASHLSGGQWFNSQPYDYGPFDIHIYYELDELSRLGLVEVDHSAKYRSYRLTPMGEEMGEQYLQQISEPAAQYFGAVKDWVKSLDFNSLVSEIYRIYPDMRVNSVFRG